MLRTVKITVVVMVIGMLVAMASLAYASQTGNQPDLMAGCYSCPF